MGANQSLQRESYFGILNREHGDTELEARGDRRLRPPAFIRDRGALDTEVQQTGTPTRPVLGSSKGRSVGTTEQARSTFTKDVALQCVDGLGRESDSKPARWKRFAFIEVEPIQGSVRTPRPARRVRHMLRFLLEASRMRKGLRVLGILKRGSGAHRRDEVLC